MKRLAVCLVVISAWLAVPAGAQKPADLKARVDALEKQVAELVAVTAQAGTTSAAVQELSAKVGALEQAIDALGRAQQTHTDLVTRGDELERRVAAAEDAVTSLATRLGDVEQPAVATGGEVAHEDGFRLVSDGGRYSMTIGGYVQPRFESTLADNFDTIDSATFRLRRARLSLQGNLGGERITYKLMPELRDTTSGVLDAYIDYSFMPEVTIRVGQSKVPFTRQWITSSSQLEFLERPAGLDNLRYDRDLGVWVRGKLFDGRAAYVAGVSNGGGKNAVNDNIDLVSVVRLEGAVLGQRFAGYGDIERSPEPRVMVGMGAAHDLVRLSENLAGVAVGERDVDGDGIGDNVRVLSASVDAAARWQGFELAIEGYMRRERWGTILDHSSNGALADAIKASADGERNYLGGLAELSYVAIPDCLLVAARVAHTRLSLLGVGGLAVKARPPADRLLELDLSAQLLDDGYRSLGVGYTVFNYNNKDGADPEPDKTHRFIVEYQWRL